MREYEYVWTILICLRFLKFVSLIFVLNYLIFIPLFGLFYFKEVVSLSFWLFSIFRKKSFCAFLDFESFRVTRSFSRDPMKFWFFCLYSSYTFAIFALKGWSIYPFDESIFLIFPFCFVEIFGFFPKKVLFPSRP